MKAGCRWIELSAAMLAGGTAPLMVGASVFSETWASILPASNSSLVYVFCCLGMKQEILPINSISVELRVAPESWFGAEVAPVR